jgi:polysaccharide export outer membrane protein
MLGKFQKPGIYTIKRDVPVLHALFLAGGVAEGADLASAFIVRDGTRIPVDLWRLLQRGDVSQNVTVTGDDTVVVPAGGELQNAVYVMGEVNKPGVYAQPEALTVLKLITLAGGFTRYAAANRVTLIRRNGGDRSELVKVKLEDIMSRPDRHEDLPLLPGDVVIVPQRLF